jgi:hypothetical protein
MAEQASLSMFSPNFTPIELMAIYHRMGLQLFALALCPPPVGGIM